MRLDSFTVQSRTGYIRSRWRAPLPSQNRRPQKSTRQNSSDWESKSIGYRSAEQNLQWTWSSSVRYHQFCQHSFGMLSFYLQHTNCLILVMQRISLKPLLVLPLQFWGTSVASLMTFMFSTYWGFWTSSAPQSSMIDTRMLSWRWSWHHLRDFSLVVERAI